MERVALITGIRRIGGEVARYLLRVGFDVALVYRSSEKEAKRIEEEGKRQGRRVLPIRADLSDPKACDEVVKCIEEGFGRLDAFLHLASPYKKTPVETLSHEEILSHFGPIVEAFLLISSRVYRLMMRNGGKVKGRIVAFGDWAVEMTPYRGFSAYLVAKGALHTAVKVLAKEFSPHVLVNCIALGPTAKPEGMEEETWKKILSNTPLRREVSLKDILSLVIYLLEVESVTGEIIMVDSGRHIAGSQA